MNECVLDTENTKSTKQSFQRFLLGMFQSYASIKGFASGMFLQIQSDMFLHNECAFTGNNFSMISSVYFDIIDAATFLTFITEERRLIAFKTSCERVDVLLVVKQDLLLSDFTQRKSAGD